ncbi:Spectinomycin tetracycline efflux pump [Serratia proteamaculans]|nr:Spectinomycin tetracycline efflux pump [Serratia proteamaculans]CAI0725038.1 Spectinomycin tetracycline efflux pump [Serratia proteamaculans]CAI0848331.1 Spectinomycin tetracycline efflux pump [Serratia proteamaculans]CAI2043688.1 Spectinomycin tetracycline efflux pump [Serratia proteamaculans]
MSTMTQITSTADRIEIRAWLQLLAACLTGILIPLSFTGPAVVLPSISHSLGGSAVQLSWVVNGYILTYGSAMMAAGSLTDIYGRKRVWLFGLGAFAILTMMIPFAPSVVGIDILRLAQGLAGAAAFAGAMASLAQSFHGPVRTRVFSLLGTTFGIGLAFGPLASGWLVVTAGWPWVFFATALIGLAGLALVALSATESRDPHAVGLDWPGAISFTAALALFTYAILLAPENGWGSLSVAGSLLLSLAVFIAFVLIERRVARPMLDLTLFRSTRFIGVQVLAASPAFFFVVLIVMLPGRFIGIDGQSALEAGKTMIALAAPLLLVPFLAALLAHRFTSGVLSGIGLLLVAVGLAWLGHALTAISGHGLIAPMLLIGTGIGLPWGLMDAMAVSVVEKERAGMATGIFNAVRVSADGIAIAIAGAILAMLIQGGLFAALSGSGGTLHLVEAANRAALGDLNSAAALLPGQRQLTLQTYDQAFRNLLYILAIASAACALLIFGLLGRLHAHDSTAE